jgi:hypothetical protein
MHCQRSANQSRSRYAIAHLDRPHGGRGCLADGVIVDKATERFGDAAISDPPEHADEIVAAAMRIETASECGQGARDSI